LWIISVPLCLCGEKGGAGICVHLWPAFSLTGSSFSSPVRPLIVAKQTIACPASNGRVPASASVWLQTVRSNALPIGARRVFFVDNSQRGGGRQPEGQISSVRGLCRIIIGVPGWLRLLAAARYGLAVLAPRLSCVSSLVEKRTTGRILKSRARKSEGWSDPAPTGKSHMNLNSGAISVALRCSRPVLAPPAAKRR